MKYILLVTIFFCAAASAQNCTYYCSLFLQNCNAATTGMTFYTSMATCMQVCASFPLGVTGAVSGNSLGCRIYHAGAPAVANATYHCPHASATGGSVCGPYCDAYCNMSLTYCTVGSGTPGMGALGLQSYQACSSICSLYVQGSIFNDLSNNTLACRIYHVQAAIETGNLAYHCPHSSPNGNSVCGTPCGAYCNQVIGACSGPTLNSPQYTSEAACLSYCQNDMQTNFLGNWNDTAGDTVGCRVYHADNAEAFSGAVHCLHAGPSGDNVCGTWCATYCDLIQQNCVGGTNSQYASATACASACAGFSTSGNPGDTTGNTVQCRIYHAGVAGNPITNAGLHCPHAGPTGGGQCVAATGTGTATGTATTASYASTVVASAFLVIAMIAALVL